jgi:hypothetical protein
MTPHLEKHDGRIGVVAIIVDHENLARIGIQVWTPFQASCGRILTMGSVAG